VTDDLPPDDPGNVHPIRPSTPVPRPGNGDGQQEAHGVLGVQALELRMSGASYQQIADALNLGHKARAWELVRDALRIENERVATLREEYRDLNLARLERLMRVHWVPALEGDLDRAKHILDLMRREAALLGLDAPKQIVVSPGVQQAADDALGALREAVIGEVVEG
jgi:hypothetical protein